MSLLSRLVRADAYRISRLHTAAGDLVISQDMLSAALSTFDRIFRKRYPTVPWLTYPAIRFLEDKLHGRTLFEYGSGTSTSWYAQRCRKVISVENNPEWFSLIQERISDCGNCKSLLIEGDDDFIDTIKASGERFDAVVVDAQPRQRFKYADTDAFRVACLHAALERTSDNCLFIVDNTDAMPGLSQEVDRIFPDRTVRRFKGWVPGLMHPNETTIIMPKEI